VISGARCPILPGHRLKGRLRAPRSTQVLSTRSLGLLNFASPRGAVGSGPVAVESAAASVVSLTCGMCVVGAWWVWMVVRSSSAWSVCLCAPACPVSRVCPVCVPGSPRCLYTGKHSPGGAGTHTGHTRDTRRHIAQRHTDRTDEPHNHPNPPTTPNPRVRGGLLSSLGGVVIRIRILMYLDVSCVYPEGYMYP